MTAEFKDLSTTTIYSFNYILVHSQIHILHSQQLRDPSTTEWFHSKVITLVQISQSRSYH